jgi:hypothetical protein
MKSLLNLRNSIVIGSLTFAVVGILSPTLGLAEGKGASKLMFVAPATQSAAASSNLAQGNCTRCTDGFARVPNDSRKGIRAEATRVVAVHRCPVCVTKITSVGAGKAKTDQVSHTCGNINSGISGSSCCMMAK